MNIFSGSLPQQIASHIMEQIIRFDIKPGERILEERFSREFKVSRAPVREALRILEKQIELWPSNRRIQYLSLRYVRRDLKESAGFSREATDALDAGEIPKDLACCSGRFSRR